MHEILNEQWKWTDPDNLQFGSADPVNSDEYVFREFDRNNYPESFSILKTLTVDNVMQKPVWKNSKYWITKRIELSMYTLQQLQEFVRGYYSGIDQIIEQYGADTEFIIAEIIFEQTSGLY